MRIRLSPALIAIVVAALPVAVRAEGPVPAVTTADLNMRTGPGTTYPVMMTLPQGGKVTVHGCTADFTWCDAAFANAKGWVSADYLTYGGNGLHQGKPIQTVGASLGVMRYQRDYTIYRTAPAYQAGPVYKGDPPQAAVQPQPQPYAYDQEMYPFAQLPCPRYPDRYFEHQVC